MNEAVSEDGSLRFKRQIGNLLAQELFRPEALLPASDPNRFYITITSLTSALTEVSGTVQAWSQNIQTIRAVLQSARDTSTQMYDLREFLQTEHNSLTGKHETLEKLTKGRGDTQELRH